MSAIVTPNSQQATKLDEEMENIRRSVVSSENEADRPKSRSGYAQEMIEKSVEFNGQFQLFLAIFDRIRELNGDWRKNVFRGDELFSATTDANVRSLFALWSFLSDPIRERAEYFERHGATFKDAFSRLAEYAREAKQALRTWESPAPSSAPALRTHKVAQGDLNWARSLFAQ